VLATSESEQDDPLASFARQQGIDYVRGSEDDVLSRYLDAADEFDIDVIVRVCGDNPLTSPIILDELVQAYMNQRPDYAYSTNVPYGCKLRIVGTEVLRSLLAKDIDAADREHVTLYLDENPEEFEVLEVDFGMDPTLRVTVDVPEDLQMIRELADALNSLVEISITEAASFLHEHDEIRRINASIGTEFSADGHSRPEVSVVVRAHGSRAVADRAIESLQEQTMSDDLYELVIAGDSTTRTAEPVPSYTANVRHIETDRAGGIPSLNAGIRATQGKYVIVFNSADALEPAILERMYTVLEQNLDVSFVYCDYWERTTDGECRHVEVDDDLYKTTLAGIMFRKEVLYTADLYDPEMILPEYDLLTKLRLAGHEGTHISEPLFTSNRRENGAMQDEEGRQRGKRQLRQKYGAQFGGNGG
jgi:spore coat polysaccharide biosynthesis protein SpsF